jgi:hypothetical protein
MALYNYDPMQSLPVNLQRLYAPSDGTPESSGSAFMGGAGPDPAFISAIQTAFARAGRQGYGGQEAFNLIFSADPARAQADPLGYANELLAKSGIQGFGSVQEWQSANTNLPGHNESLNAFNPIATAKDIGRVGSELIDEPGFQALALTAAGGQMLGGPAGAASGTAAAPTAMTSSPSAVAGSAGAPGTALFSTPAASGGLFPWEAAASTPAMTTYAGPAGTALGGATAPASLGLSSAGLAGAGVAGGSGLTTPAYGGGTLTEGGVVGASGTSVAGGAGVGGAATGGITGILSSPTVMGALGGAVLGGLGSGSSAPAGTITVEEGIPDWLQPYAKPTLDRYATELQNYQTDPYGVLPSAMQEFQKTISGQYLDPSTNKYLEDYFRLGSERVKGALSPSFGHMNAFGQHSGYNEALSRGLGDLAVGLYGGAYEKERDRQTQMTGFAPNFLTQSSTSAFAPYQQYLGTIGSLGKKKDQPYFEANPWSNVLGGAMTGAAFGNLFRSGR